MNTDIMIDLETLDVLPTATILTIGAVKFDPFGDDVNENKCEKFYVRVDVDSCDRIGSTVSQATLDWWSSQSQEAQNEAFDPANRIPIEDAMTQLYKFCWGAKRVWSHGAGFDVIILEHYCLLLILLIIISHKKINVHSKNRQGPLKKDLFCTF